MPDVLISAVHSDYWRLGAWRYVVTTAPLTAYVFYLSNLRRLSYRKTVDGGATYSAPVLLDDSNQSSVRFDIWYDRWTPGDLGTIIHISWQQTTGAGSIRYNSLDTSGDLLSGIVAIVDPETVSSAAGWAQGNQGIVKARNGNLYVQFWSNVIGNHDFYRSVDGGSSWAIRTDGADGNEADSILMFPGNESDESDIWMVYWDRSASEISLKVYDNSANIWSETLIAASMVADPSVFAAVHQSFGAVRHSDNHVILCAWNAFDDATSDLKVFDIAGAASITTKTDVLTNRSEAISCGMTINQQNDDIYITYLIGGVVTVTMEAKYKLSSDGGGVWGAEQDMSEDAAADHRLITSSSSIGDTGGLFLPVWNDIDAREIFCNANNAISIPAFVPPPPPDEPGLPEYGQGRAAIGEPSVYGATIVRS